MKQAKLFEMEAQALSRRRQLTEFKRVHGIKTLHTKHFTRADHPWSAFIDGPNTHEDYMTGTSEYEAVKALCRELEIPFPLYCTLPQWIAWRLSL